MSSYAVQQHTDQSVTQTTAGEFGLLSSNNRVLGGGATYIEQGLTNDSLGQVLGTVENLSGNTNTTLSSVFDKMVGAVQDSASQAIKSTGEAYAESTNDLRNVLDGLRPIAFYAALAALAYFIFKGGK